MRALLLTYMGVFAAVWAGVYFLGAIVVPPSERDPLWETIVDLILLTVGFVGMVLYVRGGFVVMLALSIIGLVMGWISGLLTSARD
jgi:hypothetical protein